MAEVGALALGILLRVVPIEDVSPDVAFWLTAAGGIMPMLGSNVLQDLNRAEQ